MADPAIVAALNAAFSGDDGADTLIELEGAFKNKPKQLADILLEELAKGLDAEVGGLLNARWKPNLGPQTEAFYSRADELFYGGAAGGGKQVSPDTWVKTSLGWRRADDITLDDYLIGPDDHPAQVLGIYPHVNIPLYRFTFEDESSVVTGDEHLWLVHDVTRTYLLFSPVKGTRIHTAAGRLATSADLFAEFENGHRFAVPHAISGTWTWKKAVAVDYVGTGDGLCFAVDREDGLHIIEGNTVTHNTDLIIGLCVSDISPQKKSIVFRRDYKQLKDIIERMANLLDGTGARLNANSMLIKGIPNGKTVEFGSINTYDDVNKYKGRAHDLKAFDELSDFCLTPGHEVLTPDGWKFIENMQVGDCVLSMSPDYQYAYQPVVGVNHTYWQGEIYHVKSDAVEYRATPNHRMVYEHQKKPVWKLASMDTLPATAHHPMHGYWQGTPITQVPIERIYGRGLGTNSKQVDFIDGDTYFEFAGWYFSEGSAYLQNKRRGPLVRISQTKPSVSLASVMERMPYYVRYDEGVGYQIASRQLYEHVKQFGNSLYTKRIPNWMLNASREQLELFFNAFVAGDGYRVKKNGHETGGIQIGLANEGLIDDLQIIATKLGRRSVKRKLINKQGFVVWYLYVYTAKHQRATIQRSKHITREFYSGTIHCVTVPPWETFLCRYNGKVFWSGNSENMYTFLIGWARTTDLGVPVRVVGAGNPPTSTDGEWVIRRWAPWIDPQYENPAKPGELRYFATIDGEDKELESGEAFVWKGETIKPKSRTFIPARLDDNPSLAKTDYKTVLQNMPEPLRSQLLYGDFGLTIKDDPWQVCPITWVRQSKERWQLAEASGDLKRSESGEVTYGLDVGEEGPDMTVLIKLSGQYVQWVRYLKEPDLMKQANWVIAQMTGSKNSKLGVDALGVGSGLSARLKQLGIDVVGVKVSTKSHRRARGNNLPFFNLRSDLWWYIREKLDPGSGLPLLAVYPDPKLITELSAPRYTLTARDTIQVEGRDEIKERIGRSPDAASALMLALYVTRERHVPPRLA